MTCKAGMYMSVSNKSANDIKAYIRSAKHKTAAKRESLRVFLCYSFSQCKCKERFFTDTKPVDKGKESLKGLLCTQ